MKSVASILRSHDFLEAREKAGKHISREFQDYAYRLASDLGDLPHKGIYMKLAKTVDRSLMEQAAVFALEYFNEPNKGKLFMWKLSTLRAEIQRKKDIQNFEGEFVMKKMSSLFDLLSKSIAVKQEKEMDSDRRDRLGSFAKKVAEIPLPNRQKAHRVLDLEAGVGLDSKFLSSLKYKLYGINISRKLTQAAKEKYAEQKSISLTSKANFFSHSYKPEYFSGIWAARFWSLICLADEGKYLQEFKKLLLPGGVIYLETNISEKECESWQDLNIGEKVYIRYEKMNSREKLFRLLKSNGFMVVEGFTLEKERVGFLLTLIL